MTSTSLNNLFGPPPKIFDGNTTSTDPPSLPLNTTNHLFASSPSAGSASNIYLALPTKTLRLVHTQTFKYHPTPHPTSISKKRKRPHTPSSERHVKARIDHSNNFVSKPHKKRATTPYLRTRSFSPDSAENSPPPQAQTAHYNKKRDTTPSYLRSQTRSCSPASLHKSPSPQPQPQTAHATATKQVADLRYLQKIGFTPHAFARHVFAMLPLTNFGEDLYFPVTHSTQTNYEDLFTMTEERTKLCAEAIKTETNMDQVRENIGDYVAAAMHESDSDVNIKKSSKNKSVLPADGKQTLQGIVDGLQAKVCNGQINEAEGRKRTVCVVREKKKVKKCVFRYGRGEKVVCYVGCVQYVAVVLDRKMEENVAMYLVHFVDNSNNNRKLDKWVAGQCILRVEDVNNELLFQTTSSSSTSSSTSTISVQHENMINGNTDRYHIFVADRREKKTLSKTKNKKMRNMRKINNIHNLNISSKHAISRIQTSDDDDDDSMQFVLNHKKQQKCKQIAKKAHTNTYSNNIFASQDTKSVLDCLTQKGALKENYLLKQQIISLRNELQEKHKHLMDFEKKYVRKAKKCKQYRQVCKRLYSECIHGEGPRWHLIDFIDLEDRITRDSELAGLREEITALYAANTFEICGIQKWKNKKEIEESVWNYVKLNGEYKVEGFTHINPHRMAINLRAVIGKFKIKNHRIAALNGQHGIRVLRDVPIHTCFGQYLGGEILQNAFGKVFDGTGEEHDHNIYAFDQKIEKCELWKARQAKRNKLNMEMDVADIASKVFIIDPFIGDWKNDELLLRYVNDCRVDIDNMEPTVQDTKYYNVEFVGMKVNGWPQTFLIAKRDIKKGEELMTFYGTDFSNAIQSKLEEEEKKRQRKKRIDKDILKGIKL